MTETPSEREARVVLFDMKARKGHLCQGGSIDAATPWCGCGANLLEVPDFMGPMRDEGSYYAPEHPPDDEPGLAGELVPAPPFTHANGSPCYGCQSCLEELDPDDVDGQTTALEGIGESIIDRHGGMDVDMTPSMPLLDPTVPFGPAEIEARILEANARLERGSIHEANLVAAAEKLGVDYALAYARALSEASGSAADIRKAQATLATERMFRQWKDAVAAMKAMQSVTHTLRSTLSGYQSVGKSVGAVYGAPGRGRG